MTFPFLKRAATSRQNTVLFFIPDLKRERPLLRTEYVCPGRIGTGLGEDPFESKLTAGSQEMADVRAMGATWVP